MNQFIFSFPGSFRDFLFPRNISPLIQAIGREANRANQKLGQYSDTNNLLSFVRTKTNLPIDCLFLQNILTMLTRCKKLPSSGRWLPARKTSGWCGENRFLLLLWLWSAALKHLCWKDATDFKTAALSALLIHCVESGGWDWKRSWIDTLHFYHPDLNTWSIKPINDYRIDLKKRVTQQNVKVTWYQ